MENANTIDTLRAELASLESEGAALEQAVLARRRELHQLEQLIGIVPGIVWVSEGNIGEPGQRMLFVGGQVEQLLGYTREDWFSSPSFALSIMHPDDKANLVRLSAATFHDTFSRPPQHRYIAKDGREVVVEVHTKLVTNAAGGVRKIGVLLDVTERVMAEKARADLLDRALAVRQQTDAVIASVPGLVWEVGAIAGSPQHRVIFMSDYVTTMIGYTPEECKSNPNIWREVAHPDDAERASREIADIYARGGGNTQYRWITRDGRSIWIESRINPIRNDRGEIIGARGITMDITAQKLAEEERARQKEELIRAQAAAMEELGTPLIPISEEIMVMPLVGGVDRARAERVIEALLQGISRARARFAIIDITGVPRVGADTAEALVRAARAVALLGAKVVLTGVRPEVAQTFVTLGTDLQGILTSSTLESGISYASRR